MYVYDARGFITRRDQNETSWALLVALNQSDDSMTFWCWDMAPNSTQMSDGEAERDFQVLSDAIAIYSNVSTGKDDKERFGLEAPREFESACNPNVSARVLYMALSHEDKHE